MRIEKDFLGEIKVPSNKYWGAKTQRAMFEFAIGSEKIPSLLIKNLALMKKVVAIVNHNLGLLPKQTVEAIVQAANEIIENKLHDNFPLVIWQSGAGTEAEANLNEVIANRAYEIMEDRIENTIELQEQVALNQKVNSIFIASMHLSFLKLLDSYLLPDLDNLVMSFQLKAREFKSLRKRQICSTEDLDQQYNSYYSQLTESKETLKESYFQLLNLPYFTLNEESNRSSEFNSQLRDKLSKLTGYSTLDISCRLSLDSNSIFEQLSSSLNTLANTLLEISNDIILLLTKTRESSLNPQYGIEAIEINKSIAQCEALAMVCAQVIGNHTVVSISTTQQQLALNTFKPVIAYNIIQSIELLSDSISSFERSCLSKLPLQ